MNCLHCGAETSNGLALCDLCQRYASECLEHLPTYFRNLSRQRRPGRPNGSIGGGLGGSEGGSASVVAALGRAENDISTLARLLADARGIELPNEDTEAETFAALCALLASSLTTIATLEWAGQFVKEVARHERILQEVTQTSVPGWYAGACRQETGKDMEGNTHTCGTPTYVVPGLTWVTCRGCGATTYARDHLQIVLEEAEGWIARPKALAAAIVALVDSEPSVHQLYARIRQWAHRDAIPAIWATKRDYVYDADTDTIVLADVRVGQPRYRLGDVLDQIMREEAELATPATPAEAS